MKFLLRLSTVLLAAGMLLTPATFITGQTQGRFARSHKISRDLPTANTGGDVDVIVQFAPGRTDHSRVHARRGQVRGDLGAVNGLSASLPASELDSLADDPDVVHISPNRGVTGSSLDYDYAPATTGAEMARNYSFDGTGVGVAVIDSGIEASDPDFGRTTTTLSSSSTRIVYSESFVPGTTSTADGYGHGTHVAAIIGGTGANSRCTGCFSIKGEAPGVNIINLRVLDSQGRGTDSAVIAAIQRAIALKSTYNIRVINLSLGRAVFESYTVDPLCQAVEAAWRAGIVVVVAAGNEGRNNSAGTNGYATIGSPANDPYVITVGAMKTNTTAAVGDDTIASYSSKGPSLLDHIIKPDIVAPGNRIISAHAANSYLYSQFPANIVRPTDFGCRTGCGDYFRLSGTSMAAPMVSAAAAILLDKTSTLTPDQVKARLMKTASKAFPKTSTAIDPATGQVYTSQYDMFTVGAGYLNVMAALSNTDLVSQRALSPRAFFDGATGKVRVQGGSPSGTTIVWGDSTLWGSSLVWGNTIVWGDTMVWGDAVSGKTIVWGDTMVWGDSVNKGFSLVWGDTLIWGDSTQTSGEASRLSITGEN